MKKILVLLLILTSCRHVEQDVHPEWKELNMGYKFDSLAYLESTGMEGCTEDHDPMARFPATMWHVCYCARCGYIPYNKLEYRNASYRQVREKEGLPFSFGIDTLYYGYRQRRGEIWFGMGDFYGPENQLEECQEFYRVSKILNTPQSRVLHAFWFTDTTMLQMHFLISPEDTTAIHGFQSIREYYKYWQY